MIFAMRIHIYSTTIRKNVCMKSNEPMSSDVGLLNEVYHLLTT